MKIICAGAPKTGTKSFATALKILGYDPVYDSPEAVEFGFEQWEDVFYQKQPNLNALFDTVYSKVEAVVDIPHSYFFDAFLERWPDAKVVLLLRDEESWYVSYKKMVDRGEKDYGNLVYFRFFFPSLNRMLRFFEHLLIGCVGLMVPHKLFWKHWYRRHNAYVRSVVPKSQLLEYRVIEGWEPLCQFLNKPVPKEAFPFENKATDKHNISDLMMQDTWIAKKVAKEIKMFVAFIPVIGLFLAYMYFNCL